MKKMTPAVGIEPTTRVSYLVIKVYVVSHLSCQQFVSKKKYGRNLSAIGGNGYRLYVADGIRTEKVRVDVKDVWADYVFEEEYERNSIEEVADFVKENKHLPNVPSAEEVENNGIDVANMDATLLRQIEELWLHTMDMNEELKSLKRENEQLKHELELLKTQND